jgi:hypothetical protein
LIVFALSVTGLAGPVSSRSPNFGLLHCSRRGGQGGLKIEGVFRWIEVERRRGWNREDLDRFGGAQFVDEFA